MISLRQIVDGETSILSVSHDADDGMWQFLQWDTPSEEDAVIVSLKYIVSLDPKVEELAELPLGWRAWRRQKNEAWFRECTPNDSE